jgi:aminopeptidase N
VRRRLLRAAADACGEAVVLTSLRALSADVRSPLADLPKAIERRFLKNAYLQLVAALDTPAAHAALDEHLAQSRNITDRLNTLAALWQSGHPERRALLDREGAALRGSLGGYLGFLQLVGTSPREEVFEAVAAEEARPTFALSHPGLSRSLYLSLAFNNAQLWTPRGLRWLSDTVVKYAAVSEYNTLRLIAPLQAYQTFAPDLRDAVEATLRDLLAKLRSLRCPSVIGRLEAYLK